MEQPSPFPIKPEPSNGPVNPSNAPYAENGKRRSSVTKKSSRRRDSSDEASKRRCCDGNQPACAACSQVYKTDCIYDLASDHRRKGVYKQDIDNLQTRNSTLTTLIEAILNYPQEDVPDLIRQIRTCESLDQIAESINAQDNDLEECSKLPHDPDGEPTSPFESRLTSKFGKLRLDHAGGTRYYGGTSNLLFVDDDEHVRDTPSHSPELVESQPFVNEPITSWTTVTQNPDVILHLLNMYFTWHYSFFVTLSKTAFFRHFLLGNVADSKRKLDYCSPLLVNAMLALGCHFSAWPEARENPQDVATAGDHFFREARHLLMESEEYENPRLATIQAAALMSVREAGCGREATGWTFSGIAFRLCCDLGLNINQKGLTRNTADLGEEEEDVRRMTFWGCYLFDKCWSNYLGRLPMFQLDLNVTVPKFDVFPEEESELWQPHTDDGFQDVHSQPARTRAVASHLSSLCAISSDLMRDFYHPQQRLKPLPLQVEIKRLSNIQLRLEEWRKHLPAEFEPRDGALPNIFTMHMFFHLLYIHLFRYFLRYDPEKTTLPPNVTPRKHCTHAAAMISRLMRLYKRSYGLRQICNIVVYILHSACTIHLLNLPDRNAKRDMLHGVRQLETISEAWPVARRTLNILALQAKRWEIEVPVEAAIILNRFYEHQYQHAHAMQSELTDQDNISPSHVPNSPTSGTPSSNQDVFTIDQTLSQYGDLPIDMSTWGSWMNGSWNPSTPMQATNQAQSMGAGNHGDYTQMMPAQLPNNTAQGLSAWTVDYSTRSQIPQLDNVAATSPQNDQYAQQTAFRQHQMQQFLDLQRQRQALQQRQQTNVESPATTSPSNATPFEVISRPASLNSGSSGNQSYFQRPSSPTSHPGQSTFKTPAQPQLTRSQTQPALSTMSTPTSSAQASSRPSVTSEMFGGVQALLREGQDWWVKDQHQVLQGFDRWGKKKF